MLRGSTGFSSRAQSLPDKQPISNGLGVTQEQHQRSWSQTTTGLRRRFVALGCPQEAAQLVSQYGGKTLRVFPLGQPLQADEIGYPYLGREVERKRAQRDRIQTMALSICSDCSGELLQT